MSEGVVSPYLRAPFPYFGKKRRIAALVWDRLGCPWRYIEPFCGSASVLWQRPHWHTRQSEIINDADGHITNVWQSIKRNPHEVVAELEVLGPPRELTLHACNLEAIEVRSGLIKKLRSDPAWCDPLVAARWIWGASCWIGDGWAQSVSKQLPNIGAAAVPGRSGAGPDRGCGIASGEFDVLTWLHTLAARLRRVTIACGDWSRVVKSKTCISTPGGPTVGIFFDPPYASSRRQSYAIDDPDVAKRVQNWCIEHGEQTQLRIALCGYDNEHSILEAHGWSVEAWTCGGYSRSRKGKACDKIWFSPHCEHLRQGTLVGLFS